MGLDLGKSRRRSFCELWFIRGIREASTQRVVIDYSIEMFTIYGLIVVLRIDFMFCVCMCWHIDMRLVCAIGVVFEMD